MGTRMCKQLVFLLFFSFRLFSQSYVSGELKGQLGNQCFIVAAAVSLALDRGAIAVFPDFLSKTEAGIPLNYKKIFFRVNTDLPRHCMLRCYEEPHFHYAPIPKLQNIKISGYFQSEKYFGHHKREILELFAPSDEIREYLFNKYQNLIGHPNSVSIHVRSYFREDPHQNTYLACSRSYLEKAIESFSRDALFVVFSNDMSWCRELLSGIERNFCFIEEEEYYHDFYLMSLCKHNIISNSSFSWWAAYLNKNSDKKVIAPKEWFNPRTGLDIRDLIPEGWICL